MVSSISGIRARLSFLFIGGGGYSGPSKTSENEHTSSSYTLNRVMHIRFDARIHAFILRQRQERCNNLTRAVEPAEEREDAFLAAKILHSFTFLTSSF